MISQAPPAANETAISAITNMTAMPAHIATGRTRPASGQTTRLIRDVPGIGSARPMSQHQPVSHDPLAQLPSKPEDLDPAESRRWDEQRAELERALEQGDLTRTRHALAMLERLRYGCR